MAARVRSSILPLLVALAFIVFTATQLFVNGNVPRASLRSSLVQRAAASEDTMTKLQEVVAEQLGVDKDKVIRPATLSELGADSLDIVETVMALEEAFDVELPDEETTTLKNVGDVADLIQGKL